MDHTSSRRARTSTIEQDIAALRVQLAEAECVLAARRISVGVATKLDAASLDALKWSSGSDR